jgi:uncharacterized membrane protein
MTQSAKPAPTLPAHVEDALKAIASMQAAHHEQATPLAHMVDRVTATVARPGFLVSIGAAAILWIAANALSGHLGLAMLDAAPFPLLELVVSCAALFIAVLILASQRRADRLANLQEQMTLEMALLTTQKVSKLVELIEELRRDSPDIKDRVDLEAMEMAGAPDHGTVLQAVQDITGSPPGSAAQASRKFAD